MPLERLEVVSELAAEALSAGNTLFSSLSERLAARITSARALYVGERPADFSRLYDIASGGLSASSAMAWVAELAAAYVVEHDPSVCVIENRYARKGEKSLARFRIPPVFHGDEVYHVYDKASAEATEIADTLRKASALPHFGIVLADVRPERRMDDTYIRTLVTSCRRLFLWAYDGEGFLDITLRRE